MSLKSFPKNLSTKKGIVTFNSIVIISLILIGVLVITSLYFSLTKKEPTSQPYFLKLYGPGGEPHAFFVDPAKHQKISDIAREPTDLPPPLNRDYSTTVEINLEAREVIAELAPGVEYLFFTFNGKVPGPFLRVREGDTVKMTLTNPAISTTSIDLHATTGPGGGGEIQVNPGETKSFTFKALTPGLFIYHGASSNIPAHMTSGAHGLILVEPKEGLDKVDREFYVVQEEFYTEGPIGEAGLKLFDPEKALKEDPTYIVFNGRVNALVDNPLEGKVGEKIRIYFGNAGISKISSFHIIGEIFDKVYHEASFLSPPMLGVQTTIVHAGGATVVELGLEYPGYYILIDHNIIRIDKGAWGGLSVTGEENPEIFSRS